MASNCIDQVDEALPLARLLIPTLACLTGDPGLQETTSEIAGSGKASGSRGNVLPARSGMARSQMRWQVGSPS